MTLENNQTFISPRNQKISRINTRAHSKDGKMTDNAYGFAYPMMALLVDAVISQEDNEFPRRQFAVGCSFNDIIWQQAIRALKNINHTHHGNDNGDDEHVLFCLLQARLINHQVFDLPHKWSSWSIRYSAVVADRLWSLYTAEHARNDRLEAELNSLKGEVHLLTTRLLAVDHFSFDTNTKVNEELKKDRDRLNRHRACLNMIAEKHNSLVEYISNMLNQLEIMHNGILALCENICLCNTRSDSAEAPVQSSPSLSPQPPQDCEDDQGTPPAAVPSEIPEAKEEHEIEDHLVRAWQAQGQAGVRRFHPSHDHHPYRKAIGQHKYSRWLGVERDLQLKMRRARRGNDSGAGSDSESRSEGLSALERDEGCDDDAQRDGGELQLVFPIAQEDFDALLSGELLAEVRPITILEVVWSGAEMDVVKEEDGDDDGWITDRSVAGLE
ncbi:hypothetical protein BDM02DRAFT_3132217 [Thelephora ganbajun]|uniref:Uncharacterized protein n=1 Tax=Thelephora ganbajun TaxID=370292 RepID=A0ACB6Z2L0_THEGA|nr:hypothetical protein BDM02DRAFT_3132217 [Thelephora ganbajun]